jgi:hypothetical protein
VGRVRGRKLAQHPTAKLSERAAAGPRWRITALCCQNEGGIIIERPEKRPTDTAGHQSRLQHARSALPDHESGTVAVAFKLTRNLTSGGNPTNIVPDDKHRQLRSSQRLNSGAAETSRQIHNGDLMAAHRRQQHCAQLLGLQLPAWRRLAARHRQKINII